MANEQQELTQDLVFDILSSPRRRYVLYYLRKTDDPVPLNDLAEHVAAWENETAVQDLSDQERKRVYVSLYQTHIPKLDSVGLVDYEQDSGLVSLTDRAHRIDDYLTETSRPVPWQLFYLGIAVTSAALLGLVWFDIGIFADVAAILIGGIITAAFAVTALGHYIHWRRQRAEVPPELKDNG